jgi:hypothetical protein
MFQRPESRKLLIQCQQKMEDGRERIRQYASQFYEVKRFTALQGKQKRPDPEKDRGR